MSAGSGGAASLVSLGDVVSWLHANKLGLTALTLYEELATNHYSHDASSAAPDVNAAQRRELLSVAEWTLLEAQGSPASSVHPTSEDIERTAALSSPAIDADEALAASLVRALTWYQQRHSAQALQSLLAERGVLESSTAAAAAPGSIDAKTSDAAQTPAPLEEARANLREVTRRWQTTEQQHKSIIALLAQSLPMLISSMDPVHRDALLPLLKAVAVGGSTNSTRDAARHQILTLFKRPNTLQRAEIARVWLQVANEAPSQRALQQEIIPQLYSLVNDAKWERRVLGLDCTAVLAPILATQPNVRHQLTQGLLHPLSADGAPSVRKEVPLCLGDLWTAALDAAAAASPSSHSSSPTLVPADAAGDAALSPLGTPDQFRYAMELTIQLSIDSLSNTVRHAAQTQLREVMFPLCLRQRRLVSVCVPLLLSFLADEIKPLCSVGTPVPTTESGAIARNEGEQARSALAHAAASLHLRNSLTLLNLVRDALRCLQMEIVNVREHAPVDVVEGVTDYVRRVYLEETLPTAYSLLPLCLSDAAPGLGTLSTGAGLLSEPLSSSSPHTRGTLLASVALVMASVAPVLDEAWWCGIQRFLCASIHLDPTQDPAVETALRAAPPRATSSDPLSSRTVADESANHRRCRLVFFYAFLIRVCAEGGDAALIASSASASPSPTSQPPPQSSQQEEERERLGQEAVSLLLRTFPGSNARLANESLDICARCIAALGQSALDDPHVPLGITTLLWACASASSPAVRSQAVTLISRTCNHLSNDEVKVSLICPPLLALIKDKVYVVQEAAVRCLLRVGSFLTGTPAQEKALQPVMDVVQAAGCTSDLTVSFLQYVEELVKEMPSEPRENQLYLLLCVLMDQLADQQMKRVTERNRSGTLTPANAVPSAPAVSADDWLEQERWEATMLALQSLLGSVLHCAVVSPHLIAKFLLPGIKHLGSESVQRACSSTLRSRWSRVEKAYDLFMENSRSPGAVAAQNATNLLNRMRDELKKHF